MSAVKRDFMKRQEEEMDRIKKYLAEHDCSYPEECECIALREEYGIFPEGEEHVQA